MIKTMCCLGCATLSVVALTACGTTTPITTLDNSKLSTGDSNAISTGGYWWTYTDHNAVGSPYHATISQLTSASKGLEPVVDSDTTHGKVIEVSGTVPAALPWLDVSGNNGATAQAAYTIDPHWQSVYPDATVPDYPSAGVGFGYQHYNKPFDATGGGKYVGIAFDMKLNTAEMPTVWVTMAIVGTDLPDPSPGITDAFPKPGDPGGCKYYTATNTPNAGAMSCFTSYRKGFQSTGGVYNKLAAASTWHRYCVLYSEVEIPNWANAASRLIIPPFDPTRALKVQWDMYQPPYSSSSTETSNAGTAANYDISLDNVYLITSDQAKDATNNCDQGRLGQPFGSGDAG